MGAPGRPGLASSASSWSTTWVDGSGVKIGGACPTTVIACFWAANDPSWRLTSVGDPGTTSAVVSTVTN